MARKFHKRFSLDSLALGDTEDKSGRIFISESSVVDLSEVNVILTSIDTIRQLYKGVPDLDFYERCKTIIESGENVLSAPSPGALDWHVSHAGKTSGYQIKLQNNEEGIILLFKSFYAEEDKSGAHLKIELSPKFISSRGVRQLQQQLDMYARNLLVDPIPSGVAVHLAVDVQGWEIPDNFVNQFVTRSRTVVDYSGMASAEYSDLSRVAVSYGDRESYLFGKASSLQMAVYRKDREIVVSDKEDYYHRQWDGYTFGKYDKCAPVWRIEARFHHNVIRELGNSRDEEIETVAQVIDFMGELWGYALNSNRLDMSRTYIDPFWQLLIEDCVFTHPASGFFISRKKKESVGRSDKNYALIIGNLITVCARQHMNARQVHDQVKKLSFYEDILSAYRSRGKTEGDLREQIEKGLCLRRLIGKAA
ncbi:MAG: hypothetical protein RPU42_04180 [Candidatus Sedimenticola sp. (ex Thyasira tokunagai)]